VKVVESLLEWVPLAKDDGHNLTCKVSHSKFKNYNEFRHVKMDIQCKTSNLITSEFLKSISN
jgi:hypothetical protein